MKKLLILLILSPTLISDEIVQKFKNPSFSGQGTAAHYLKIENQESKESLLEKERIHNEERQKVELALESFYRSAHSLCFQINKRYIPRYLSILRVTDRRFETGEIFIKWDEASDDDWLLLIYIKKNTENNDVVVIEDKSNPEQSTIHEFQPNEIFKASDVMVDALTKLLDQERNKRKAS